MLRTVFLTLIICMSSFFAKAQFLERPLGLQTEGLVYTLAFGLYDTIHDLKSSKAEIDVENPSLKSINENAKYDIRYRLNDTQQNENSIVFIVPGFGSAHDNGVANMDQSKRYFYKGF